MINYIKNIVEPRRLLLAWQAPETSDSNRTRWAVGEIIARDGSFALNYFDLAEFARYNDGSLQAIVEMGYVGYPAFKIKKKVHSIGVLEAFMRRIPPRTRSDFSQYQYHFRISENLTVSDFAMLALTEAKLPSDGFSIVDPFDDELSQRELVLEVAGFRHYADANLVSANLLGQRVEFEHEPENVRDVNAIRILLDGQRIGYVNRLQTRPFHRWLRENRVCAVVERLNGDISRPRAFIFVQVNRNADSIAA